MRWREAREGAATASNCASVIPPKDLVGAIVRHAVNILSIFSSMVFGLVGI